MPARLRLVMGLLCAACAALAGCMPAASPSASAVPATPRTAVTAPPAGATPRPTATPEAPPAAIPRPSATALRAAPSAPATALTATPAVVARVFKYDEFQKSAGPLIQAFMQANHISACSLAVAYPDAANALQTSTLNYGTLSPASTTPADANTVYEIGSLSKLFAADLLAYYVREGQMRLDDPVQKYLPAEVHVPTFNGLPISLRDLATHTSGLPRNAPGFTDIQTVDGVPVWGYTSAADVQQALSGLALSYAPGTHWLYSSLAFSLLQMAEEKVGGADFETLLEDKLAVPLGLRDTRVILTPAEVPHLAQGLSLSGAPVARAAHRGESLGAAAVRSTAADLALYLTENMDVSRSKLGDVLALALQSQWRSPIINSDSGLGWNISAPGTQRESISKNGATDGYGAYIAFSPPNHTGFAVACNGHNVSDVLVPSLGSLIGQFDVPIDDAEP